MPLDPASLPPDALQFVQLLGDLAQIQVNFNGEVDTLKTDIERLEDRLAEAQETEGLVEALFAIDGQERSIALITLDGSGCIRTWSRCAENLYGYPADEILGRRCQELEESCSETISPNHRRIRARHKDGSRFPVESFSAPVRNAEGLVGYVRLDKRTESPVSLKAS